ncbi:MAG: ribonuclease HI family protein [Bdellovibrionales bacterium]|nr:ribonuclease HI family protein [Bdellovibrionales bacterium]
MWSKKILIYTDGACRGNRGPCSIGLQVFGINQDLIYEESAYLEDNNTNNFAEYKAVIRALELSVKHQVQDLTLFSDSQFLVYQMQNKYKVKTASIKKLFDECKLFIKQIPRVQFKWIPRDKNKGADLLANQALDQMKNKKF